MASRQELNSPKLIVAFALQCAFIRERTIVLAAREYAFLGLLARQPNVLVQHDEILGQVWKTNREYGSIDQIKSLVKRLRKKIEPSQARNGYYVLTGAGGYFVLADRVAFDDSEAVIDSRRRLMANEDLPQAPSG